MTDEEYQLTIMFYGLEAANDLVAQIADNVSVTDPVSEHLATAGDALTEAVAIYKQRVGEALGKVPAPELEEVEK